MPKKEEVKIPKKVKEEMTEQIIEEIHSSVKEDVLNSVVNDIKTSFDKDYKNGIKNDIKAELIDDIKKDINKEQKKLSRAKSFKIFRLYIYLLIVVGALLYILFRLYQTDNLTVIDKSYTRKTTVGNNSVITETTTTEEIKDGAYYIKNYGYLMDKLKISNVDLVKGNILIESLPIAEKLAMAYLNLDLSNITVDGIIHTLSEDSLKNSYKDIFGSFDGYTQSNFNVNGLNYAYSSSNSCYMAIGEENLNQSIIKNILVNGYEEGDVLTLEARAYVVKDGAIYNPNNMNYRITTVTDDLDITKIQNRLLSVEYKFQKNGNTYNLISIVKK